MFVHTFVLLFCVIPNYSYLLLEMISNTLPFIICNTKVTRKNNLKCCEDLFMKFFQRDLFSTLSSSSVRIFFLDCSILVFLFFSCLRGALLLQCL